MRALVAPLTILLLTGVLAGCLSDDDEVAPPEAELDALFETSLLEDVLMQDHDHSDRSIHGGAAGMELLGYHHAYDSGDPDTATGLVAINEIAAWENYVYVSRGSPAGGFSIIDIEDPTNPAFAGDWDGEHGFDIEVTHDGKYVLFATQRNPLIHAEVTTVPVENHQPRGLYVVDVSNPAEPEYVSFLPHPWNGVHTMEYLYDEEAGEELVIIQTYDLTSSLVPGVPLPTPTTALPPTQRVTLATLDRDSADVPRVVPHGLYQVQEPVAPNDIVSGNTLIMPHDSHVERHPITGERLLYVAYWDAGLRIVNIDDLANPIEIASWTDFSPSDIISLHDVKTAPTLIDGRHITVTGPEIPVAPETGQFTVFDTTDPTNPEKLGHWGLPVDLVIPGESPFLFSPHVFYIDDNGVIVAAHNHAGAWMIDIGSEEKLMQPEAIGYALPTEGLHNTTFGMGVWTAMWWDGLVLVSDVPSGLYIYQPTNMPERAPSPTEVENGS